MCWEYYKMPPPRFHRKRNSPVNGDAYVILEIA